MTIPIQNMDVKISPYQLGAKISAKGCSEVSLYPHIDLGLFIKITKR